MDFPLQNTNARPPFSVTAYLVIGPNDTKGRNISKIIKAAVASGFTMVQLRAKDTDARTQISLLKEAAQAIKEAGKASTVPLLVNDRLDVALAARAAGIAVAGVHVGQKDIAAHLCRIHLGENAIIGLSAHPEDLPNIAPKDLAAADYIGTGPLHRTASKPDAGIEKNGRFVVRDLTEIKAFAQKMPIPVIVGGGVKAGDLKAIKKAGAAGFFVISAVAAANDVEKAALELLASWHS